MGQSEEPSEFGVSATHQDKLWQLVIKVEHKVMPQDETASNDKASSHNVAASHKDNAAQDEAISSKDDAASYDGTAQNIEAASQDKAGKDEVTVPNVAFQLKLIVGVEHPY